MVGLRVGLWVELWVDLSMRRCLRSRSRVCHRPRQQAALVLQPECVASYWQVCCD